MINLNLPALFVSPHERRLNNFYRTENSINKVLGETEEMRFDFRESQKREAKLRTGQNELQAANPDLVIADKSVENMAARKRLTKRKWFTVIIEAILAISSVKLFFGETLNVKLTWPMAVLCGLGLAYVVLNETISYRNDDAKLGGNAFEKFWNRYSWFVPLLLIPFLNIYNVVTHPGNPTNPIWIFFAVFSVWLNIKCAGYAKQYALKTNTAIAESLTKPINKGLEKEEKVQTRINRSMIEVKAKLMDLAANLKRLYESFGENKPNVNLNPLYILLLNNRFYMYQFLPIPDITIVNPPAGMNDYMRFWDEMQRIEITPRPDTANTQEPPVQLGDTGPNPDTSSNQQEQDNATQDNNVKNRKDDTAPGFDDMINDDEIFV